MDLFTVRPVMIEGPWLYFKRAFLFCFGLNEKVVTMAFLKKCSFYREYGAPNESRFRGYCDLDHDWIICRGDIQSCKKVDLLRKYLLKEKRKEGGAGW